MNTASPDAQWKTAIPRPIADFAPQYLELYWRAWQIAHDRIRHHPDLPQPFFMDEAFQSTTIWIWDTCFIALYCKYAPAALPGIESLNNFYAPMHDPDCPPSPMNIQHPDNPPLFAWAEEGYFKLTNDIEHIRELLVEKQYLQKHFQWFDTVQPGWRHKSAKHYSVHVALKKVEDGYFWNGIQSGMDNTPRQDTACLWVDAIAQQGLSALCISRLAEAVGLDEMAGRWRRTYDTIKAKVNDLYWDDADGIYYDIDSETREFSRVKTPAAYWPMLAEMCSPAQAARLLEHALDGETFGTNRPWASVARSHPDFTTPDGNYWRGGIWLPLSYMATKALEIYGYLAEADQAAQNLLDMMWRVYEQCEPHSIWECYSPTRDTPADVNGKRVRGEFCGWSALGPISMFIENILGFHVIDAPARRVEWRLYRPGRHGIENLHFGDVTADIVADGKGEIAVTSNAPFTLVVNGAGIDIQPGQSRHAVAAEGA